MAKADKAGEQQQEAKRLKCLAEANYKDSNLKTALKYAKRAHQISPYDDSLSTMVTAFKILRAAYKSPTAPDWYKILQAEPFCQFGTIKKQYKKLALALHPDKNTHVGSEEAFKLVNEGFRFLSDKVRRKEYDMKLRIQIQDERIDREESVWGDTFWTACSTCRLLHQFERKYLGHSLVCPSCRKSFEAMEVGSDEDHKVESSSISNLKGKKKVESGGGDLNKEVSTGEWSGGRLRQRMSSVGDVMERSHSKSIKIDDEMMTLAEFQCQVKRKAQKENMKSEVKDRKQKERMEKEKEMHTVSEGQHSLSGSAEGRVSKKCSSLSLQMREQLRNRDLEIMAVEDSDFYDFDKDRVERSFKPGQVWAIYDDDDGMPRHYGLIDEVVSANPFEVKISWLDFQSNMDYGFRGSERMGFHVSCGRFKVSRKTCVSSVNIFSHIVDCERAAREVYRVYPKKGSVWALYRESTPASQRCYEIVVFLTTYSEMHGLSMAYLEKVDGFKSIFKRREIGPHAIRCLEKDNVGSFSHQIPVRKLSGDEAPGVPKDCWELDPASLPEDLLRLAQRC